MYPQIRAIIVIYMHFVFVTDPIYFRTVYAIKHLKIVMIFRFWISAKSFYILTVLILTSLAIDCSE